MKIENIKFKAKIGNVWEYGYPIKCADGWGFFVESRYEEGATLVDNKETICQYTGVNDKNGKEVYINDIVRTKYGRLCVVKWFLSPCQVGIDLNPIEIEHQYASPYDLYLSENLEVIGNIYDNKELIK